MGESQAKMREFVYSLMDPKPQMSILGLRPGRGGAVFLQHCHVCLCWAEVEVRSLAHCRAPSIFGY
jgi:hypothetical protein